MDVLDQVRIIVYRFQEKGLEILLVNHDKENDPGIWKLPGSNGEMKLQLAPNHNHHFIKLDPYPDEDDRMIHTVAIEGDWHDIPNIRSMVRLDHNQIRDKFKEAVPDLDTGSFFGIKEAFRKVLPHEYTALKELKDILWDRNVLINI